MKHSWECLRCGTAATKTGCYQWAYTSPTGFCDSCRAFIEGHAFAHDPIINGAVYSVDLLPYVFDPGDAV